MMNNDTYILINPEDLLTPEEMSKNFDKYISEMVKHIVGKVF